MARAKKGSDLKLSGSTLGTRFSVQMSLALAVVMLGAGAFLYHEVLQKADEIQENAFVEAVQIQGPMQQRVLDDQRRELSGLPPAPKTQESAQVVKDAQVKTFPGSDVSRYQVFYGDGFKKPGFVYRYQDAHRTVEHRVVVTWSAEWSLNGGPLRPVNGTVTTTGPATPLRIAEASPALSGSGH